MERRQICFVVSDLLGLVTNSAIGTASSHAALVLAGAGYAVTLLHIRRGTVLDPSWEERYKAAGIEVEVVPRLVAAPSHLAESYSVYEHLRNRSFDVIAFQDWMALGWACTQARHAGVAFGQTQLVHVAHGPEAWLHEANLEVALDADTMALAHAGQTSAELSDAVVGPSRYLLDWMTAAGWRLPDRQYVVPYFTEGHARTALGEAGGSVSGPRASGPVRELAFFGRLERRKGVQLFAAALNEVEPERLEGRTISFLGREATFTEADVRAMLDRRVHRAAAGLHFHTDLDNDDACRHLARPGTLVVVASLVDNSPNTVYECIERGIPFVATGSGGTAELVHEDDRARCLVDPEPAALARALAAALSADATPEPVRPSFDMASSLKRWGEILAWGPPEPVTLRESPLVSAVVPHHDRPALLLTALDALDAQDYANLEIVVVDDGSRRDESRRVLGEVEARAWRHELRVVRQENRYLGAARNAGAATARGDLLAFADDDDVVSSDFVSTLVRAMQSTRADAVTCAMRTFTRADGPPAASDSRGVLLFAGGPLYLAAVQNCLGGAPALMRRSAFEAVGGYHERQGVGVEDWHLYVRLLLGGHSLVVVPEPLYWYRLHPHSMRLTMSEFDSAHIIIEEFRAALPPALRNLADLAYGQDRAAKLRIEEVEAQVDLRDRLLWLAEERLRRLDAEAGIPLLVGPSGTDSKGGNNSTSSPRSAQV